MRFRSAGRLSPADLGRRVTVRMRTPDGRATDVLGTLEALEHDQLRVRRTDGELVQIPVGDVIAARAVRAR